MQIYLRAYELKYEQASLQHCYETITPKSYILKYPEDCETFLKIIEGLVEQYPDEMPVNWLIKNSLRHKGQGIKLVNREYATNLLAMYSTPDRCVAFTKNHEELIAQHYIGNPALIANRKFDFRVFMIIVNVNPLIVVWAPENGHTRLSDQEFDPNSTDFTAHITADVKTNTKEEKAYILEHRFNLRELGQHFKDRVGDPTEWLEKTALPKVKKLLIDMVRASQQNFVIQRAGLLEFYGVDLIMADNMQDIYLLESNRRPNVQEESSKLKYREDGIVQDTARVAEFILNNKVAGVADPKKLYESLEHFVPLIDETKKDPYFGIIPDECQKINVHDYDPVMPLDPMLEPLIHHFRKDRMKFLS